MFVKTILKPAFSIDKCAGKVHNSLVSKQRRKEHIMQNTPTDKTYAIVGAIINVLNANPPMADDVNALYAQCDALHAAQRTAEYFGYNDVAYELLWYRQNIRAAIRRLMS
jgi:hypothetical protein